MYEYKAAPPLEREYNNCPSNRCASKHLQTTVHFQLAESKEKMMYTPFTLLEAKKSLCIHS